VSAETPNTGSTWRRRRKFAVLAAAVLALLHTGISHAPAETSLLRITTTPIASFNHFTSSTEFGVFSWRGGLTLASEYNAFGGLSGIVLRNDCEDMLAISDNGTWFKAKLTYTGNTLTGLTTPRMEPVRDSKGRPQAIKLWADAEAITPLQSGKIGVAYERKVRFGTYDIAGKGLSAPFKLMPHPRGIDRGPENGEVESFGQLPSGDFIAIAERQRDAAGNTLAWIWRGNTATSFSIERYSSYNVTDLAVLADGSVLTLERSFTRTSLPGMAIRRFKPGGITNGKLVKPDLLLEASLPLYAIDNMEGIALCERHGETRITLVSDNNFSTILQSTVLLQFALKMDALP
jgi:hypothetical protein